MPLMTSFLNTIVNTQRERIERSKSRVSPVGMEAAAYSAALKPPLDFAASLKKTGTRVIAEIKKSSPSAGSIRPLCDTKQIAAQYAVAGAAAISVVTEEKYFGGDIYNLIDAREGAPSTPLLRKDFIVDIYQIFEARHFGADAVLLIKKILSDDEFRRLAETARSLKMSVLAETHDEKELDAVLSSGVDCAVGVNSRNLDTFEIDAAATEKLLKKIPSTVTAVAESAIKSAEDIIRLKSARGGGQMAFLIGSALMKHPEPGRKLSEIISAAGV
ncbi:MAG: indole-3-glycerol-phosphate synthase TrpC [Elusimicrobia bacterium HGW-Elusimicrobia-1]|nr:MAG: indole-3-glycerol-phosphate synthase TrpC [Elusimicrobia bacterium HGW-Elusimicrobia-1]